MVRGTGRIHLGGPPIVKAAINEIVDGETLGGAEMHTRVSGVSDYLAETRLRRWPRCATSSAASTGRGRRTVRCARCDAAALRPRSWAAIVGPS